MGVGCWVFEKGLGSLGVDVEVEVVMYMDMYM